MKLDLLAVPILATLTLTTIVGCTGVTDDADAAESELSATSAEIHAAGFVRKAWFKKTCPKGAPLPSGCDLWKDSIWITRYEHADGRILFRAGEQIFGSYPRGSTLHTVLASEGRTYRHGRHVLFTLRDVEWTKTGEPTLVVDIDVDRADLGKALPSTIAGVPLELRGDVVHADAVRATLSNLAFVSADGLGLGVSYHLAYGQKGFPALKPQLVALRVGDTYVNDEILHDPDGELTTHHRIATPSAADVWATVASPLVTTGALKLPSFTGGTPACAGGTPLELDAPAVVACDPDSAGCSTEGKRIAIHLAMEGEEVDLAYVGEAKPIASTILLDGGRIYAGKDSSGGDVTLTLEPAGAPWQVKLGGRTYGMPDNVRYGGCRARR